MSGPTVKINRPVFRVEHNGAADSSKLPLAGGTMTGRIKGAPFVEVSGESPDGWPLIPVPNDGTHPVAFEFQEESGAGNNLVLYQHRGHVIIGQRDAANLLGYGAGAVIPYVTIGGQITNGMTIPNGLRFNNDPAAQGSALNPYQSGIRTGYGTGIHLVADYTVRAYANNVGAFEWSHLGTVNLGEKVSTVAAAGSTETLSVATANVHDVTLDASCTFTFTGATSGKACSFSLILRQDATGGHAVTWPASVDWPGGSAPTISTAANAVDVFSFLTVDGGTTWLGFVGGQAFG